MKLSGNTILITGGTSGIGFELASQLLKLDNTLLITGRDQARLDLAQSKLPGIHTFLSDVSDPGAIPLLYEKVLYAFPEVNVLINNAGVMRVINLHDKGGDLIDLTREIETNLNGPLRMVKQFLTHLKSQKNAAIVNISSGLAFVPLPVSPVYCAAKAGLHSFTLSLRVQLKKTSVKVFELMPPTTRTHLFVDFRDGHPQGVKIMEVDEMVRHAIKGFKEDCFEIRPGQSNSLRFMNRVAPQFIQNQLAKSADFMLSA